MATYEEQIFPGFGEELRSSVPVYPASRQALPGSEAALEITVGSGRQCSMLCNQSSPLGAFSKILMESSLWGSSPTHLHVWERLDTRFGLSGFQLTALEPCTEDTGSSLFATPQAHDCHPGHAERVGRFGTEHGCRNLNDEVMTPKLWPTAHANCSTGAGSQGRDGGLNLQTAARLWPMPTVQDGENNAGQSQFARNSLSLNATFGGSLSPKFVEWLMGFPRDWTLISGELPRCPTRSHAAKNTARPGSKPSVMP